MAWGAWGEEVMARPQPGLAGRGSVAWLHRGKRDVTWPCWRWEKGHGLASTQPHGGRGRVAWPSCDKQCRTPAFGKRLSTPAVGCRGDKQINHPGYALSSP